MKRCLRRLFHFHLTKLSVVILFSLLGRLSLAGGLVLSGPGSGTFVDDLPDEEGEHIGKHGPNWMTLGFRL